jgi:hypothetical protein
MAWGLWIGRVVELSLYASNSKPLGFESDFLEIAYLGRDTLGGLGGQRGAETLVVGGTMEAEMRCKLKLDFASL